MLLYQSEYRSSLFVSPDLGLHQVMEDQLSRVDNSLIKGIKFNICTLPNYTNLIIFMREYHDMLKAERIITVLMNALAVQNYHYKPV